MINHQSTSSHCFGLKGARIKRKLSNSEPIFAFGLVFPYPMIAESLCGLHGDVFVLDMEHCPWTIKDVANMLAATSGSRTAVVARPANADKAQIQLLLDLGVDGIMVAHVDDLETARAAIDAAKYPPIGKRGVGPTRAGAYLRDQVGYIEQANDSVMLWLQVEKVIPDEELEQMLRLRGVDALMLGPADMASSMGHLTAWDHVDVTRAIDKTLEVARRVNIPFGVPGQLNTQARGQLINFISCDVTALQAGFEDAMNKYIASYQVNTSQ